MMDASTVAQQDSSFIPRTSSLSTRRFRPYPEYKDSGVEWLGEIPVHWEATRLKFLTVQPLKYGANEAAELNDPDLPRYIRITDIREDGSLRDETFKSLPEETAAPYFLEQGDILFARSGATVGKTFRYKTSWGRAAYAGYLICARLNEKELDSRYVSYFTQSTWYWNWLRSSFIQATIQNVSAERYANLQLPIPLTSEQRTIAEFLERETGKIDALVTKKERLIELFLEKRTALITQAVTKGLDPNVPMKDSGVEWLGKIPAHWEVARIKNLSRFVTSGSRGWAGYYSEDGSLFLRIGNLNVGTVDLDLNEIQHVTPPFGSEGERTRVQPGDLLISITALIGAVGVVPSNLPEAYVNQHIALVRLWNEQANSRWLAYCILSRVGQTQFIAELYGGTKDGLGLEDIRSLIVLLPPADEQKTIVEFLDHEAEMSDILISKIREGIERLKEFRTALISAAVTGKIDVGEEVA